MVATTRDSGACCSFMVCSVVRFQQKKGGMEPGGGAMPPHPPTPAVRAGNQRYTRTGTFECVSTLLVSLPSSTPVMPRRPCEAIMIRSHLRFFA